MTALRRDVKPRVVYWNGMPSPYMEDRFNAVANRGNLDFEAWFSTRSAPHRSWQIDESTWQFKHHYVPDVLCGRWDQHMNLPTRLFTRPPDILVSLYAQPSFLLGWLAARSVGARTAFYYERTSTSWVKRTWLRERVKAWVFPRVDGFVVPGPDAAAQVQGYGVDPERVQLLPHSTDVGHFSRDRRPGRSGRDGTRKRLGLRGTTFIYIGRLWRLKGLDHLIEAFTRLERRTQDVSLLLVGDGNDEAYYRRLCRANKLRNVVFTGFVQKEGLPELYAAADTFVFPTLGDPYGLVVDEAMAAALPVISTSAAGEISTRIEDGVSGFIVPPGDASSLLVRMEELATSPALRESMGERAAKKIAGHTPEQWARDLERDVDRLLSMPRAA